MGSTSLILIGLFFLAVNVPSVLIAWLGIKFLEQLGRYPSRTPAIQMSIILKLAAIEVGAFTLILALFKVLSPGADAPTGS